MIKTVKDAAHRAGNWIKENAPGIVKAVNTAGNVMSTIGDVTGWKGAQNAGDHMKNWGNNLQEIAKRLSSKNEPNSNTTIYNPTLQNIQ